MSKKLFFGSNLKMYKNIKDTVSYLQDLESLTKDISRDEIELFIIPSYTTLDSASKAIDQKNIRLGAQNMCWEEQGQFTGEISPLMLQEAGIGLVMIGHSERRHVFGETDIEENKKVLCALEHGFKTLLCIGETAEEKEFGISAEVNGTPASADYAEEMHKVIKATLCEIFGDAADEIPALYGGSVNPGNACDLIVQPSIDGLFTGRAAWQADKFNTLIRDAISAHGAK